MKGYNPYWQVDLSLGDGVFSYKPRSIRMLLHVATDSYSRGTQEIVPLPHSVGMRTAVHARPYITRPMSLLGTILHKVLPSPVPAMPSKELL
jgi:hypothetical protein